MQMQIQHVRYGHILISAYLQFLPQQHPPPPTIEQLDILVTDIRVTPLNPGRQLPHPLLHRLGDPQGDLILEDK